MKKPMLLLGISLALWGCSPATENAAETSAPAEQAAPAAAEVPVVDVAALKQRLDAGEDVYLLDVRNPDEIVEHGMIPGSVNIPMDQLEARVAEVPKDKPIVTYCMRGGRADRAAQLLRSKGYEQPIESGGITAWKEAGYEVVQPKSE